MLCKPAQRGLCCPRGSRTSMLRLSTSRKDGRRIQPSFITNSSYRRPATQPGQDEPREQAMLVDVSHTVEHGMITYKGLPAPLICDFLSREQSRSVYAPGTE